jgi:prepilin peptidase CpaA
LQSVTGFVCHRLAFSVALPSCATLNVQASMLGARLFTPGKVNIVEYSLLLVFPALMIFAAMMDLFTMTIPNRISIVLVAIFLIAAPLTGMSWEQFFVHLGTGFGVLAIGITLFAFGFVGGGDAKLLAAASLWIGFNDLGQYMFAVVLLGGLLSVLLLMYRGMLPPSWLLNQQWALRLHNKNEGIPYGLALSGAALWIFPVTGWFTAVAV